MEIQYMHNQLTVIINISYVNKH